MRMRMLDNWDTEIIFSRKKQLKPELPEDILYIMLQRNKHLEELINRFDLKLET